MSDIPSYTWPWQMSHRTLSGSTHSMRSLSLGSVGSPTWVPPSACEQVEHLVGRAVVGRIGAQAAQGTGPPAGLLDRLPHGGLLGRLSRFDAARRDLPAPRVGDEAVPPDEQHPTVWVADDRPGRRLWVANDVVVEPLAARDLDVHQHEPEPLRVVEGPLTVDRPAHRVEVTGMGARGRHRGRATWRCGARSRGRPRSPVGPEPGPLVEPPGRDPSIAPHEVAAGRDHVGKRRVQDPRSDAPAPAVRCGGHASQPPGAGPVGEPRAALGIDDGGSHHVAVGRSGGERRRGRVVVHREAGRAGRPAGP